MKPRRIANAGLLIALLAPALLCAQTVHVPFHWTEPADGAPVEHYNIYHIEDSGAPHLIGVAGASNYVLAAERGVRHQIQVSGVAADGREGPVSQPSDEIFFEIPQSGEEVPSAPALRPNFPNPFNPQTTIAYGIPENLGSSAAPVLEIYDLRGERIRRLTVEDSPGWHTVVWNGTDDLGVVRSSGQYVVRFRCGGRVSTWKMTMLK